MTKVIGFLMTFLENVFDKKNLTVSGILGCKSYQVQFNPGLILFSIGCRVFQSRSIFHFSGQILATICGRFSPQIVDKSKFNQSRKDKSCTDAHPHINSLKINHIDTRNTLSHYVFVLLWSRPIFLQSSFFAPHQKYINL